MTRKDIFNIDVDENGYPVNKDYLEANLPDTLQRGIDELNACDNLCRIDLYQDELYGNVVLDKPKGQIEFKNVSFKYRDEEELTLNNLNLKK